jgi:hypothetical protein
MYACAHDSRLRAGVMQQQLHGLRRQPNFTERSSTYLPCSVLSAVFTRSPAQVAASGGSDSSSSSSGEVMMQFVLEKKFAGERVQPMQQTKGLCNRSTRLSRLSACQ